MAERLVRAWIGLGSNLGDRGSHLARARAELGLVPGIEVVGASRIYETEPVGPEDQGPYLNAVIAVDTELSPRHLLERLLDVERQGGRTRSAENARWGPRAIDLDLLFYGDATVDEAGLAIPHPRLHARAFVLEPLCELAPAWVHPGLGDSVGNLRKRLVGSEWVEVWPGEIPGWSTGLGLSEP